MPSSELAQICFGIIGALFSFSSFGLQFKSGGRSLQGSCWSASDVMYHFPVPDGPRSLLTSGLIPTHDKWGSDLEPTRSMRAPEHGIWLYCDLDIF